MRIRLVFMVALLPLFAGCDDENVTAAGGSAGPLAFNTFQEALLVIGQPDLTSGDQNAGGSTNAVGFQSPFGSPGQGSLSVPDGQNNRVLVFDYFPALNGASADFVIGQPDFTSKQSGTSATAFNFPSDCVVANGKFFLCDASNHRVLIWNRIPRANTAADVVIGQPDFTSNSFGRSASRLFEPIDIAIADGKLFVSDVFNNRVLIWNSVPTANGTPADVVIGQIDFDSGGAGLSATELFEPNGLWASSSMLIIGDRNNARVLIYNSIPTTNGAAADVVVGAPDFNTTGGAGPGDTKVSSPYGVASDGTSLFVADDGLNRVLVFTPIPTANGTAASVVLGQSDFNKGAENDPDQDGVPDAVSARTFFDPTGVTVIGDRLLVTDQDNHRILVFTSN